MKYILAIMTFLFASTAFAAELTGKTSVYFDYDASIVKQDFKDGTIKDKADWLAEDSANKVRLEAFADDRGTHTYNLGLTQRRADAVASALKAQGASSDQIEIAVYSEENAIGNGHCEECWATDRRVDIHEFVK